MKKFFAAVVASAAVLTASCASVESTRVDSATIASNGEAVAVVQCSAVGLTALFHFVTISEASLDTIINKSLVAEAKALGANKIQLVSAGETPKGGLIFRLVTSFIGPIPFLLSMPGAQATAIAVR